MIETSDVTDIEADAFDEHVKGSDVPVVFEFWIRSCGFCQKFKPVYEQLPNAFGGRDEVPEDEHDEEHHEPEARGGHGRRADIHHQGFLWWLRDR